MAETRIYVVTNGSEPLRLVEASSQAQAIQYVVKNKYQARVATTKEVASHMQAGITIENATTSLAPKTEATPEQDEAEAFKKTEEQTAQTAH